MVVDLGSETVPNLRNFWKMGLSAGSGRSAFRRGSLDQSPVEIGLAMLPIISAALSLCIFSGEVGFDGGGTVLSSLSFSVVAVMSTTVSSFAI